MLETLENSIRPLYSFLFICSDFTDDDIVAQCVIFFIAGFTGVAQTLSFLCCELVANPEVQEKLYTEIADVCATLDGEPLTYEHLRGMKYLDCVVTEILRLWSVAIVIERRVSKQYLLDDGEGVKVVLQPGDSVWIPAPAIMRDPQHYPEPESFRPERFFADAQPPVDPATYMPFGAGPRGCVASRFALLVLKTTIFHFFRAFRVTRGLNTVVPLKLKATVSSLEPADPNMFVFQLKLRDEKVEGSEDCF